VKNYSLNLDEDEMGIMLTFLDARCGKLDRGNSITYKDLEYYYLRDKLRELKEEE